MSLCKTQFAVAVMIVFVCKPLSVPCNGQTQGLINQDKNKSSCGMKSVDQPLEEMTWKDLLWKIESTDENRVVVTGKRFSKGNGNNGEFNLDNGKKPLEFIECEFDQTLDFDERNFSALKLTKCRIKKIDATNCYIQNKLELRECEVMESILLDHASIGHLQINYSIVRCIGNQSMDRRPIKTNRSVSGKGLQILRYVDLSDSCFKGELYFQQSKIDGEVKIYRTFVGGEVTFDESSIGKSFSMLDSEVASGTIRAPLSSIAGNLDLAKTKIRNSLNGESLYVYGMKLNGSANLDKQFMCDGSVIFNDCRIGAALALPEEKGATMIDLTSTECQRLAFASNIIPKRIDCAGFSFKDLSFEVASANELLAKEAYPSKYFNINTCRDFCEKAQQSNGNFGIFKKFATAFENHGDSLNAREFRILAEKYKFKYGSEISTHMLVWYRLGWWVGYGYKPLWVGVFAIAWIALSSIFLHFFQGSLIDSVDGNCKSDGFNALLYSLDTFLPFVDLRYADHFKLKHKYWSAVFVICHVFVGWFLASMFITAISGWTLSS